MNLNDKVSDDELYGMEMQGAQAGEDEFGALGDDTFGAFNSEADPFNTSDFGADPFSGGDMGADPFNTNNPYGEMGMDQQQAEGTWDRLFNGIIDIGKQGVMAVKTTLLTLGTRTADEMGLYYTNVIKVSILVFILAIAAYAVRLALGTGGGLFGPSINYTISCLLLMGTSFIGFGISAYLAGKVDKSGSLEPESMYETEETENYDPYESAADDALSALMSEDEEAYNDYGGYIDSPDDIEEPDIAPVVQTEPINYKEIISGINNAIPYLARDILYGLVTPLFRANTPDFSKTETLDEDDREYKSLNALAKKALASAAKKEISEISSSVIPGTVKKTLFSYQFKMPRVKGLTKLDSIESEMEAYFADEQDNGAIQANKVAIKPSCIVALEGDNYKITVTNGQQYTITYGDLFSNKDVCSFFRSTDNKLPFVGGITELGQPILLDAKNLDSMLVTGQPRSGKSWHVLNLCLSFMFFNPPSEVQMIIIDPKGSNLFKTVALLPHVIGLHGVDSTLAVLNELIETEAPRRKKLLSDNYCENVWDLRKRGVTLPIVYLVIDEVITVINELGSEAKEFNSLLTVVLTQLPSLGIRPILVPHRAQGVVEKTIRENIHYRAAIRATTEVVKETTGLQKWTMPLQSPGDSAIVVPTIPKGIFAHGVGITSSDFENTELIEAIAQIMYKSSAKVDYPRWLRNTYNRDESAIQARFNKGGNSAKEIMTSLDELGDSLDDLYKG